MRQKFCGRAAILAFVAHLLGVDVVVSSSSSSFGRSSLARHSSRSTSSPFFGRRPSPSSSRRRWPTSAFVNQGPQAIAGRDNHVSSGTKAASSSRGGGRRIRTCIVRPESLESSSSVVAPRYYKVDASCSQEAEFSLLRPHLEFSELDLQQLFTKRASSSSDGPSQLYEEFEEDEISQPRQQ